MNENHNKQRNHELNEQHRKLNSYDHHRNPRHTYSYDEEFAADDLTLDKDIPSDATSGAVIFGFIGLAATIIALFNYSFTFALIGIALGFYAGGKGAKALGIVTISIGLLAVIFQMFFNGPFISLF